MDPAKSFNDNQPVISTPDLDMFFSSAVITPDPVRFTDVVFKEAIRLRASDLFFEPQRDGLMVRIRIDGVLYKLGLISLDAYDQITARIKVMATLDPTERRKIQEGQIVYTVDNRTINLRVEIAQTVTGELIVLRIHEKNTIVLELSQLGFNDTTFETYKNILNKKSGLIVVCGPTGCGKTTTLYSTLMNLGSGNNYNIMTIEDPVEFQIENANQMQVNRESGFTFAQGLKTILRLSPDIILVGEIRDKETAEIAVETGLTGQMVLSTIHADDSVGGIFRLLDLGIEPYFLNSSLHAVIAQRLVRKLCNFCKKPYKPEGAEADLFEKVIGRVPETIMKNSGCNECGTLGFNGRVGIFEVLEMSQPIREMIRIKNNENEFRASLIENGFISLLKDGLIKVEQGITTIDEILRNNII